MSTSADGPIQAYARVLLDTCLGVQPGWQVLVVSQPLARPLVEEVTRQLGARGAYAVQRLELEGLWNQTWLREAPLDRVGEVPSIQAYEIEHADAIVAIL